MFMQPVDLAEIVRQAVVRVNGPVEIEVMKNLPTIQGDRRRLADAVEHLVENAVKFSPSEHTVRTKLWIEANKVQFEVIDRGLGIPTERLAEIWQPFRQQAGAVQCGVEGLGLGLPLTRYIVKAHGGDVWVESVAGQGSRFGFWLPA